MALKRPKAAFNPAPILDPAEEINKLAELRGGALQEHVVDETKLARFMGRPQGAVDGVAAEVLELVIANGFKPNPEMFYTRVPEHRYPEFETNRSRLTRQGYQFMFDVNAFECVMFIPKKLRRQIEIRDQEEAAKRRDAAFKSNIDEGGDQAGITVSPGTVSVSFKEEAEKARKRSSQGAI